MIFNYIKLGIRNLLHQKSYTIINIVGLSIGIAAFLLIFLHIQYELGFNKHIPEAERLYRCVEIQQAPGVGEQHVAVTMGPLAEALVTDFPEIEKAVRMLYWGSRPIQYNEQFFNQEFVVFTDPEVFELFGVKLIVGDTATALKEINSFVVSKKVAEKMFGSVEEAMGKIIQINSKPFHVTGVMEDQPKQASFRLEALIPFEYMETNFTWLRGWNNNSLDTYVRLKEGTDAEALKDKFPEFVMAHTDSEDPDWMWKLYLQPVLDIHLKSGHIKFQIMNYNQGNITMVYMFSIIAALIILLACINFINLSIAQSVKRSREVGMRKVMGADRFNLMNQFLGESFIITLMSVILALLLVYFMLPYFNEILGAAFKLDFYSNWIFNIGLLIIIILVSLVAGIYPAFYLSRYNPIKVLKRGIESEGSYSGWLTKSLVVFQFVISIGMIFSIAVIYDQFKYALNKDMGINYTDVLSVNLYEKNTEENVAFLKNEFLLNSNVKDVAFVSDINGVAGSQGAITVDDTAETSITVRYGFVDYNFFEMMEIPIIAGRNFDRNFAFDDSVSMIINRAAVEYLGWEDPIGKQFRPFMDTITNMKVIGVIEDYHYYSIHSKIEPAIYLIEPDRSYNLAVKINGANKEETIAYLQETWDSHFPGIPFNFQMAKDRLQKEYKNEESTFKIFTFFTLLSLVISCLGLYGLTALIVERKSREIGIRKVFGGSVMQIVKLILSNFIMLIIIAGTIATPIAWYLMNQALDSFAYHISITWIYFAEAILMALLVAAITILYHALKAAMSNPVDTLRYE
ncbi:MAG: ABC transporter permease [Bacteroidetes bacterium]|nr:ABC transporter permease [Bacteroidota bacterium]